MKLSIIIPVMNNSNFTRNCLFDLAKLPSDHEIIIVNNASTDGTREMLSNMSATFRERLKVIHNERNFGFGKANNIGYAASKGEYVLFLNNDIRVRSGHAIWTQALIDACSGALVSANGGLLDADFKFVSETDSKVDSPYFYLSGWCLAGSRDSFDKLILPQQEGPWNEAFFAYYEDDDISWRAQELGIELKVVSVPVEHFGRMTSKKLGLFPIFDQSYKTFCNLWKGKK